MAIKVQCPECGHEMTLKTFKAGRFKPTCTHCKSPFQLVIGPGDSPELKVAKLAPSKPATDTSSNTANTTNTTTQPSAAGLAETIVREASVRETTVREAALPVAAAPAARAADETLDHAANAAGTQHRSTAFSVSSIPTVATKPSPAVGSASGNDATLEMQVGATAQATSPPASSPTRQDAQHTSPAMLPDRLGGYRILKELGRGGMGAVYLAKQLSLDRNVAVKTIQNDWSANPRAVARFIREAYAAAQLTHHNVVQIYDLGQDTGINFFSMELVEGGSLDDLLKRQGRLSPKQAATYILHAARGLRFAHDHGMIHRDIKPANLMLTSDSLVKVADLGLVKTPSQSEDEQTHADQDSNILLASARSHVTGAGSTLGTPAYMAPEQAEDATSVDHRADIYSLGCTFYALLVGKPPYANRSAVEILSKIKTEPIARVDSVVKDVPTQLASIVAKMTAKQPDDRYQSLQDVIQELESFLDAGAAQPRERADKLQSLAEQLQQVPAARLQAWLPAALIALMACGALIGLLFNWRLVMMCGLVLALLPVFLTIVNSVVGPRSPITQRARAMLLQSTLADWVTWTLGFLVALIVVWVAGLLGWTIGAVVVAAALAAGVTFGVVLGHARQRRPIIDQAQEVVREMRLQGIEEPGIAAFIAEFAGKHWEGLLESLFGYETLRSQRAIQASSGQRKSRSWLPDWRDLIVDRIDARLNAKRERREQRVLAKVEAASLQAAGVNKKEAEEQAAAMANSLVMAASETRQLAEMAAASGKADAASKRERIKQMMATARFGKPQSKLARASRATGQLLNQVLGGKLRFAIGACLLIGCAMWANQNQLFDKEKLNQVGNALQTSAAQISKSATDLESSQATASKVGQQVSQQVGSVLGKTRPLAVPVVGPWFTSLAPGIIGLLIALTALVGSWRWTVPAAIAAVITLLGPTLGLPSFGLDQGSAWLACAVGAVVLFLPVVVKPLR